MTLPMERYEWSMNATTDVWKRKRAAVAAGAGAVVAVMLGGLRV